MFSGSASPVFLNCISSLYNSRKSATCEAFWGVNYFWGNNFCAASHNTTNNTDLATITLLKFALLEMWPHISEKNLKLPLDLLIFDAATFSNRTDCRNACHTYIYAHVHVHVYAICRVRKAAKKKKFFFGKSFPNVGGWGGWFPNKVQTPQNPPKLPRKSPFLTQISPFVFPNLTKTLVWVGG